MPLMTSITKGNGHALKVRWGWWHVRMMVEAARSNTGCEQMTSILDWPPHAIVMEHDFSVCDVTDREVLTLKKGWKLDAWRS